MGQFRCIKVVFPKAISTLAQGRRARSLYCAVSKPSFHRCDGSLFSDRMLAPILLRRNKTIAPYVCQCSCGSAPPRLLPRRLRGEPRPPPPPPPTPVLP